VQKLVGRDFFRVDYVTKDDGSVETDFAFVGHKEMFDEKPIINEDPRTNPQFMQDVEGFFMNNPNAQEDFRAYLEKMEDPDFDEDDDFMSNFSDIDSDNDGSDDEEWDDEDFEDIFRSFEGIDDDNDLAFDDDDSSEDESMDELDLDHLVNEAEAIDIEKSR
jgi:hypothetical protein